MPDWFVMAVSSVLVLMVFLLVLTAFIALLWGDQLCTG